MQTGISLWRGEGIASNVCMGSFGIWLEFPPHPWRFLMTISHVETIYQQLEMVIWPTSFKEVVKTQHNPAMIWDNRCVDDK